jgi:phosphodiesterase/alkaline phosphatase D-like protein
LQALHANFPMIMNTDDHEMANDAWEGGAQNHSVDEGDWNARRNAAMQVWREWLPVGEQPWKEYSIGDLATYYRTDSRAIARSKPYSHGDLARAVGGGQGQVKAVGDAGEAVVDRDTGHGGQSW